MTDSLLPSNSTPLETALALVEQGNLDLPIESIPANKFADTADEKYLPHLAYEESADTWSDAWSEERKRTWIEAQWNIHRRKGTRGAMEDALAALQFGAVLAEWYEYDGLAYHFRIEIDLFSRDVWRREDYAQMWQVALREKPVRAFLEAIIGAVRQDMPEPVIATGGSVIATLEMEMVDE